MLKLLKVNKIIVFFKKKSKIISFYMRYFLKRLIFFCLLFSLLYVTPAVNKQSKAEMQYVYTSQDSDPSYNIFTGDTWDISPYLQIGYSFLYAGHRDYNGVKYESMLRNRHHGFTFGFGIAINRYWSFGISFQKVLKKSHLRGEYALNYPCVDAIKHQSYILNFDIALMAPFEFFNRRTRLYLLTGPAFIFSNLEYNYNADTTMVPVALTKDLNKTQIGINLGLGVSYNLTEHFYLRMEGRKIFIITKNPALKNTWSLNVIAGISF